MSNCSTRDVRTEMWVISLSLMPLLPPFTQKELLRWKLWKHICSNSTATWIPTPVTKSPRLPTWTGWGTLSGYKTAGTTDGFVLRLWAEDDTCRKDTDTILVWCGKGISWCGAIWTQRTFTLWIYLIVWSDFLSFDPNENQAEERT